MLTFAVATAVLVVSQARPTETTPGMLVSRDKEAVILPLKSERER